MTNLKADPTCSPANYNFITYYDTGTLAYKYVQKSVATMCEYTITQFCFVFLEERGLHQGVSVIRITDESIPIQQLASTADIFLVR